MRYTKDHKQATRQRILEAAGRRFKQDGIDGAGLAAVMSDADLTNGAFYAHFSSKEDLVANVLAEQLRAQRQSIEAEPADRAGLEAFVRSYLSPEHRDQAADGCPSAALLDEIARRPADTREVFTEEVIGVVDNIASRLNPTDVEAGRVDALTVFGWMVGTLQLARTLTDRDLSDQLLARGVETAVKLLDDLARSWRRACVGRLPRGARLGPCEGTSHAAPERDHTSEMPAVRRAGAAGEGDRDRLDVFVFGLAAAAR
jgi:TetR/AcrR family transcriptional repressor of nem operon